MLRNRIGSRSCHLAGITLLGVAISAPALAQNTLPTNGHVVAGSATIAAPSGNTLSINQTSNRAVVNWNSFSVGQPNVVDFTQPSSSAAILNRVTGATPSAIAGQIEANGQVYLVNPNGIAITPSGSVQVGGGFVASTLGISNGNFMSGNLAFTGNGASAGVSNAGAISTGNGGYVALIGGTAANSGVISVPLGKVALGSGEQATLDLNGDGFMQVAVPTGTKAAHGQALVSNSGRIVAAGGTVEMRAATVATAIRDAVNMSGVVAANSVSGRDGAIVLDGGPGGTVAVTGRLDASARAGAAYGAASLPANANGGAITVDGARVRVGHRAVLNASGAKGGTVLVGVSAPGGKNEAARTTIASGAQILASGDTAVSGSGGHIETSGVALQLGNAIIDAGRGGSWLTDPSNLTIDASAATTIDTALAAGTNVTEQTTATGTSGTGIISTGNGDIDVASALSWNTPATLTLSAYNNITVSAPITVSGGGTLALTYNNAGANPNATLAFVMGQGSAQFTTEASNPSLFINNGTPGSGNGTQYTLIYKIGAGTDGMEGMNAVGNYALAAPLDASTLGTISTAVVGNFGGNFNGLGNTISNLTISGSTTACFGEPCVGLFGQLNPGGTIANLGVIGGSITLTTAASALLIGDLVGFNDLGTITNSYATGSVTGGNNSEVGGLVGLDWGDISSSYATGTVTTSGASSALVGGLVAALGDSAGHGTITNSYATGAVSGPSTSSTFVGGLVGGGNPGGSISLSFATGGVSGGGAGKTGGFMGLNEGALANDYWDTNSSGTNTGVGSNTGTGAPIGLTTTTLASALPSGFSSSVWTNLNNQVSPYIITNPGPVIMGVEEGTNPPLNTLIFTEPQLQAINTSTATLSQHYILARDIDATAVTGFTPIGEDNAFTGVFNGFGNVIANLTISENVNTAVGLFSQSTGTIENLGLVAGSVTQLMAGELAGGLIGSNTGTILSSYSTAAVTANNYYTGGLVGENLGTITDAYATGAVTVHNGGVVGGLVGLNASTITNAYATGAVAGGPNSTVGGLVGLNAGLPVAGQITNAYAAGAVTVGSGGQVGGLIGSNSGSVTNGYWDADRSAASTPGVGFGTTTGVHALSGTQPFTATSFAGFTFTTTPNTTPGFTPNRWVLVDADGSLNNSGGAAGGAMPMLASEAQSTIQNAHQLQLMAMNVAGSYTLGRSIDATATGSSTGPTTGTDVWTATGFVPITGASGFTGTFNGLSSIGDVNTITNLTINTTSARAGLFASIATTGTVENVGLIGGSVTGSATAGSAGDLAGSNSGAIINTFASGAVNGPSEGFPGGLVGANNGTISASFASGTVTGSGGDDGGLVGANAGSITDAYATGAVGDISGGKEGGLVGVNQGPIIDAYATGAVGGGHPAGLIGLNLNTVTDGYYDAGTTGQPLGTQNGAIGVTTAQLQAALPTLVNPGKWGIIAGKSYPYLCFQSGNCGETPQVVSGTVYTNIAGTTPASSGITVNGLINASALVSAQTGSAVSTGANGYYYYLLSPNTIEPFHYVLTYAQSYPIGGGATASGAALSNAGASASGLNIYANTLHDVVSETAYSAVVSDLDTALGGNGNATSLVNGLQNLWIDASGSFAVDAPISTNLLTLNSGGQITENGADGLVQATTLTGSSAGNTVLNNPNNLIQNLSAFSTTTNGANGNFTLVMIPSSSPPTNALNIIGAVNTGTGTLSLTNGNTASPVVASIAEQPGGSITAGLLTGSAGGSAFFQQPGNMIANLGPFTETNSANFALTDAQALNVSGSVNAGSGSIYLATTGAGSNLTLNSNLTAIGNSVQLYSAGTVAQPTGFITAATVTGSSVGGASMPSGNNVSTFGPWGDTGAGSTGLLFTSGLTLTTAGTISSAGPLTLSAITEPDLILNSNVSGTTVTLFADGNINQTAGGITATNLQASTDLDAGGSLTLNSATNTVTGNVTLSSLNTAGSFLAGGAISFTDSTGLTIVSLGGSQSGVATTGAAMIIGGGDLTIAAGATVTGNSVVLSTPGVFINDQGAGAVAATGGGRWLIYSSTPGGDTFGNLDSGNTVIWGATFATLPPASVTASGDRYLFAQTQALTVTTTSIGKTYGQDATAAVASAFTESGFAPGVANAFLGDTAATVVSGTPIVTSTGSSTSASVVGGPYPITAIAGSLTVESGYSLAFANTGVLTVNPAALTASITGNPTKIYDGTTAAALAAGNFTLTGFVAGQGGAVSAPTGSYASANAATGIGVSANFVAGEFTANTGTLLSNYTLPATAAGTGAITPATLTASITGNPTKIYDGTTAAPLAAGNFTLAGFVAGQGATVSALTGSYASANAATGIGVSANLVAGEFTANTGTLLGNYTLPATAAGTGAITPAMLTASITGNPTKIYDGTTAAALAAGNFTLTGFVAGQGGTVSAPTGSYATANAAMGIGVSANLVAGEFTANAGTLFGNYTLPTIASGTGTITPAALTITPDALTKIYGNSLNFAGTEFSANGLLANDTVTSVSLASVGAAATAGVGGSPYPITASEAVGTNVSNYAITYLPGALTVTPRLITVTANDLSRFLSQPNPPLTYAVTAGNLANGDVLSGALATTAISGSLTGAYPITQGTLAATSNYGLTFVGGILVVTATPDFGVSPNRYIAPVTTFETAQSDPTPCSPGDLALALDRAGSVVVFGARQWDRQQYVTCH